MNVIMESSEDLVNWTTDSLGPKIQQMVTGFFG